MKLPGYVFSKPQLGKYIPFFGSNVALISGFLYLWPVSKHYAKKELKKVWDEI